jgi:hypothetical protein
MNLQRKYRLVVGKPKTVTVVQSNFVTDAELFGLSVGVGGESYSGIDLRTETLNAVEITDLGLEAHITSSSNSSSSSKTTIKIYNLSKPTLEIVERLNNYVILEGGFESDPELKLLFTGQVSNFETRKEGSDLVTTLTCGDGYTINNDVRIDKSYPKGVAMEVVIRDLISQYQKIGVAIGNFTPSVPVTQRTDYVQVRTPAETIYPKGYSVHGYLKDVLKQVCESVGYVSYITNGKLFVHPKGYTTTVEQFEYSIDGLYSAQRTASPANGSGGKEDIGLSLSVPLDGRLDVDKQLVVLDGDYSGTYKILTKVHKMSYPNGEWVTNLTCKKLNV